MAANSAAGKDASAADFVCKLKFRNTLPEIPFDPKLRNFPFDPLRLVRYKANSLEKSFKYPLLSEPDLGIPIDLIDPETYRAPAKAVPLAPEDAALIKKENFTPSGKSRSEARPAVPWLRKMEYMTDFTREARQREREQAARAASRSQTEDDDGRQRERIERGFEAAKETPVHRTKPHLTPVSVQPLVPDLELIQNNYTHVVFETTPMPDPPHPSDPQLKRKEAHQEYLVSRSVLKAYTSNNEEKVVVFMVPQKTAEEVYQMSLFGEVDDAADEVPYSWVRKYLYNFNDNNAEYVLLHDKDRVRYIPVPLKSYLSKAPVGTATPKPSQITVRKRPLTEEELAERKEKVARFETEPDALQS